jgi:hypothetical protein
MYIRSEIHHKNKKPEDARCGGIYIKKKRMQIGLNNISFRAVFLFCKPQKFPEGIKRKKDISKSDL